MTVNNKGAVKPGCWRLILHNLFLRGKKILYIVLLLTFTLALCCAQANYAQAKSQIQVFVEGQKLDLDVNPLIQNGRTLIPARAIMEALGASVSWNGEKGTVFITNQENN
ncbi:MAG: copper amine oxidase N-terminal domain-containing protein, partial [Firmicutes bacterium]|nr:copper amine oxidase N-terminal domain-containing protein [Bacillota bacterium]